MWSEDERSIINMSIEHCFFVLNLQMVRSLVSNGANLIWEHTLSDPGQMKSGVRKPNPKDAVQYVSYLIPSNLVT